jgi:aerobic-type carbon monoxide dehydrogenase small subunit (CoxS/CutS family)
MTDILPTERTIELTVNGEPRVVDVEVHHTLLEVLRDDLRLTGTKECCLVGECGACTVLIDGRTVDACLVLAVEADGASVLTVEGLAAPGGRLAPLQAAFLDKGAVQCGFCIPGQLVSAHALLAEHPHPTPAEIEEGIAGNLCRCGCYEQIFEAIEAVAEGSPIDTGLPGADAARDAGGSTAGGRTNAEGLDQ